MYKKMNRVEDVDHVLEMSIHVGYLGADVKAVGIDKMHQLLSDECISGLVAMERGEVENHLHFQMVVRARTNSTRSFDFKVRKYMGWTPKDMYPAGRKNYVQGSVIETSTYIQRPVRKLLEGQWNEALCMCYIQCVF